VKFSGISGMMNNSDTQSLATFNVSPLYDLRHKINITAIVLPHIAICEYFYVDDGLTGADTCDQAIKLQTELQTLFSKGGFLL
jgi:hypothetical protein